MSCVAVIGAGSFGTAIAWMLSESGTHVRLWSFTEQAARYINEHGCSPRFLKDCKLDNVVASNDLAACAEGAESIIIVTPSFGVRSVAENLAGKVADDTPILILSKGLDPKNGKLLYQTVAECVGHDERIAVLAGPNHAEELGRKAYAGAVIAAEDRSVAEYFQHLLSNDFFRLYVSEDPVGASLCAASKNVIAIACGIARGLDFGDNAISLLITRGLAEISRLVTACGGSFSTCLGLAGVGDLNTTCNSPHSRNGSYGVALAKEGISVADYEAKRGMVVEGAHAIEPLLKLAASKGVELPIMEAVGALLAEETDVPQAIRMLMGRALKPEM